MPKPIEYTNYTPLAVSTLLCTLYSFIYTNLSNNFFNFISGNSFEFWGMYLSVIWLFSACWLVLSLVNNRTPLISSSKTKGLYHIAGLRDKELKHVSAKGWNEESRKILNRLGSNLGEGASWEKNEIGQKAASSISISGNFESKNQEHKGEGKAQENESSPGDNTPSADSNRKPDPEEVIQKETQDAKKATLNTALKGSSFATESQLALFKNRLNKHKNKAAPIPETN